MSYVYPSARQLEGKPKVDGGECARLVQHFLPHIGLTSRWRPGENVIDIIASGRKIPEGTAIANFVNGRYPTSGARHAAFFLDAMISCAAPAAGQRCRLLAIKVMDQWNARPGAAVQKNTISSRPIKPYGIDAAWPLSDNASMFYIIE